MISTRSSGLAAAALLAGAALLLAVGQARAATLVIDNADAAGQGLNDPTPFSPVGGNTAATLGAARLAVFQQAAVMWGAQLHSSVPIHVSAGMVALPCTASSAVLASTGAASIHRDFPAAPVAATWYPQALANALSGSDLDPTSPDMETQFNSTLGASGCLTGTPFYLGLDAKPGPGQIDMLTVVLHELAHGLGFQSYADFTTGATLLGFSDAFLLDMQEFGSSPAALSAMTDQERVSAAVSDPDLYWSGAAVQEGASVLSAGLISGHVRLYAPATFAAGSSVSHYSTALTPNELLEPFYTGPNRNLTLTLDLLHDIGWPSTTITAPPPSVPALPAGARVLLVLGLTVASVRFVIKRPRPSGGRAGRSPGGGHVRDGQLALGRARSRRGDRLTEAPPRRP